MDFEERLEELIKEGNGYLGKGLTNSDTNFKAWNSSVIRFAEKAFGEKSTDAKRLKERTYGPSIVYSGMSEDVWNEEFEHDLKITIAELNKMRPYLKLEKKEKNTNFKIPQVVVNNNTMINNNITNIIDIKNIIEDNTMLGESDKNDLIEKLNILEELQKSKQNKN